MTALLKMLYDYIVDWVTPPTYWGWKFIAGSVGVNVERPWTVKICIYFWPVLLLILSPILALAAIFTLGPLWALLALVFAPPVLSITLLLWAVRLTPVLRLFRWADKLVISERTEKVFKVVYVLFMASILGFILVASFLSLFEKFGWWALPVLFGILLGIIAGVALIIGGFVCVFVVGKSLDKRRKRHMPADYDLTARKSKLRAVFSPLGLLFKAFWLIVKSVAALLLMPFYLAYAAYKNFCPVRTYPASQSIDSAETESSS